MNICLIVCNVVSIVITFVYYITYNVSSISKNYFLRLLKVRRTLLDAHTKYIWCTKNHCQRLNNTY